MLDEQPTHSKSRVMVRKANVVDVLQRANQDPDELGGSISCGKKNHLLILGGNVEGISMYPEA